MTSIFIFRRDLRLHDNTTLIYGDKTNDSKILPIFIFDPYQIEDKHHSNNCVQFLVESLLDLDNQLKDYGSHLTTFYGKPWNIVNEITNNNKILNVYVNKDYTVYSKQRDKKIENICKKNNVNFVSFEDCMLHNVASINTKTGKYYEKFTPYFDSAKIIDVAKPQRHIYNNLVKTKSNLKLPKIFTNWNKLYTKNPNLYMHGGRQNGLNIIKNINDFNNYNSTKNEPKYDTTLLSPHNKFGTLSIREIYYQVKNNLGEDNEIIRNLYWRDFYYVQMYNDENYHYKIYGKYANKKWKNNEKLFNKWKNGKTGIPIVDAGIIQLKKTGWIHNRIRLIVGTQLVKYYMVDWRKGEEFFKEHLIDYDITQNIMNWYWISSETPFSNPPFRTLNPKTQALKYDKNNEYSDKIFSKYL